MPSTPTTRAQVDGHRFLLRRARQAVVSRDVRMLHDPLGRQDAGLAVGLVVALVASAGAALMAFVRPAPDVDRAQILVGRDSGAMYVRAGDTVHPVLNLASARLVLGSAAEPVVVRDADLAKTPRGGLLGIPGAPSALPPALDAAAAAAVRWTVCDEGAAAQGSTDVERTVVVVDGTDRGQLTQADAATRPLSGDSAVLASFAGSGWLLRDGTRSAVDLGDRPLLEALGLADAPVRPVSAALLDSLPEIDAVRRPRIAGAGEPVPYALPGLRVGQVFTVTSATGTTTYVALRDGVQEVGTVLADVVRSTSTVGDVVAVPPDAMDVPRSTSLGTAAFPRVRPSVERPASAPVLCVRTTTDAALSSRPRTISSGARLPAVRRPVEVAAADGPGPAVDAVSVPGSGVLLGPVPRGTGPGSAGRTVLDDTGVRHEVPDDETAAVLGLGGTPVPVEGPALWRLPSGPALDRPSALRVHDGLAPDPAAVVTAPR